MHFRVLLAVSLLLAAQPGAAAPLRVLDDFEDITAWKAVASDSVTATLRQVDGAQGKALCLDYDFNGVSGYAVAKRELPLSYPENYAFALQLRGHGPANNLEFKLGDASGENVWWVHKPDYPLPQQWTPLTLKKRQIDFAWGPSRDKVLRKSQTFELTVSAGKGGGKGAACIDTLTFRALPSDAIPPPHPVASASIALPGGAASNATDSDAATAWRAPQSTSPSLVVDMGREREFGGVVLHWRGGEQASHYRIALSQDGEAWRTVRTVAMGNGGTDPIALPESDARFLRLQLDDGPGPVFGLSELTIEPLAFAASTNDFLMSVAKDAPRGWFPRGFIGQQSYWTIVGIDGGTHQGLIGEDGAVEFTRGGASVAPMVIADGKLVTWADVETSQSLQDGYLPIPSVRWRHRDFGLQVTAFARGHRDRSQMLVRYRLDNPTSRARDYVLALALQPWQVNPPSQFLNTPGGSVPIGTLLLSPRGARIGTTHGSRELHTVVRTLQAPDAVLAAAFDQGMVAARLATDGVREGASDAPVRIDDETGLASGALLYRMRLAPGQHRDVVLWQPLSTPHAAVAAQDDAGSRPPGAGFDVDAAQRSVAAAWHEKLDRVGIHVPRPAGHVVDTLRTALANMLISRDGPRLQPGTRSYARAWIRDGAMISDALLRMGHAGVAEDFVRWYARFQFDSGKVPCCVDDRGSDPVPENDSQGELIHAVAQVYRHTHDRRFLEAMWPHVAGAVAYMDALRNSQRTDAIRRLDPAFHGLMPASISHEGYSSKPMHSYWDDFWSLRGYDDAVEIAQWLGRGDALARWTASRDQFRDDLHASIATATQSRHIDFIPGSAELGDFDPTSTTIALTPGGQQGRLPDALLRNTFERYWTEFVQRRDGQRAWEAYTPYELRTIGSFVRLGWRDRAQAALAFFLADQQPPAWNQWAEVVSHAPRKPFFVGDLPHAWVASDYVRSVLDLFAYERDSDGAMVLAAGLPRDWMRGTGVAVSALPTSFGRLSYTLREADGRLHLHIDASDVPRGGFVLPWPYDGEPGSVRVDGVPARWQHGELKITRPRADVEISAPESRPRVDSGAPVDVQHRAGRGEGHAHRIDVGIGASRNALEQGALAIAAQQ